MVPNVNFISLTILELFALNAQKFMGLPNPDHGPVLKKSSGAMSGLFLGACVPNLKSVFAAILELLALNAQKFTESCDLGHASFYTVLTFRGSQPPRDIV